MIQERIIPEAQRLLLYSNLISVRWATVWALMMLLIL